MKKEKGNPVALLPIGVFLTRRLLPVMDRAAR